MCVPSLCRFPLFVLLYSPSLSGFGNLQCLDLLPSLAIDILQRLVELFQVFNTRTHQLILGAGAIQTAGLKSISAKHLCMQSVAASSPFSV